MQKFYVIVNRTGGYSFDTQYDDYGEATSAAKEIATDNPGSLCVVMQAITGFMVSEEPQRITYDA